MSADVISTERGAFGSFARSVYNDGKGVILVAYSETDAGADAVALAIRDLTEEIRLVRKTLSLLGLALGASAAKNLSPEHARWWGEELGKMGRIP